MGLMAVPKGRPAMPRIAIKGTDTKATIDVVSAGMLPKSIWVNTSYSRPTPVCRYKGTTMTLLRAVGLANGLNPDLFVQPVNGNYFDCRLRNAGSMRSVPTTHHKTYKNSISQIKGIRTTNGKYAVVLHRNGKDHYFGSTADLDIAIAMLTAAKKKLRSK
jgi:hypothetical protein